MAAQQNTQLLFCILEVECLIAQLTVNHIEKVHRLAHFHVADGKGESRGIPYVVFDKDQWRTLESEQEYDKQIPHTCYSQSVS